MTSTHQKSSQEHATAAPKADLSKVDQPLISKINTPIIYALALVVLYLGWINRNEFYITPEWGLGYGLGLFGGIIFLLIIFYPLRKNVKLLRNWGSIKIWFHLHMIMGIVAPVAIFFHSNFQLGSTNSNVALFSMVLVVASGLIGRYVYAQVHYGLSGAHASLEELEILSHASRDKLDVAFGIAPEIQERLKAFEDRVLHPAPGMIHSASRHLFIKLWSWWVYWVLRRRLLRSLERKGQLEGKSQQEINALHHEICHGIAIHLAVIRKIAEFSFYERFFAKWHVVHIVFYFMLFLAGIVHVIAVHIY